MNWWQTILSKLIAREFIVVYTAIWCYVLGMIDSNGFQLICLIGVGGVQAKKYLDTHVNIKK